MISTSLRTNLLLVTVVALLSFTARAQNQGSANQNPSQPEGWETNGYVVHQSIEIGYRANDVTGSQQMYNTLVNLRTGPRLLDQSLSMQSQNHVGTLFDNLFVNSFGWGGDPNNAQRLREVLSLEDAAGLFSPTAVTCTDSWLLIDAPSACWFNVHYTF